MNKMQSYVKFIISFLAYAFVGAIAAVIAGYLLGAVVGLAATFYNNNFLPDTAQAGYLWWANFFGYIFACFSVLPGAGIGAFWKLVRFIKK